MKFFTNAALCTLHVSQNILDQDVVLALVVKLASPLQLTTVVEKAKNKLELKYSEESIKLTQRNTVLRALCGIALYHALDHAPYYLMGGTAAAANNPVAKINYANIVALQSLAETLKVNDEALQNLEQTLEHSMFLANTAQPTLADMDIAIKLKSQDLTDYPNLMRWRATVLNVMKEYGASVDAPPQANDPPVAFFYGTEDMDAILKPAPANKDNKAKKKNDVDKKKEQKAKNQPKEKKETQPKQQQQQQQAPDEVDISALDIRVGKIVKAWHHEEADKLFCEEIDLGTETRQIASGLRPFYKTEDLQDGMVLVLCNLKKRNLVGFPSHGMVLCASNDDHTKVEFVVPPAGSKVGERVVFEGFRGEPEPENKVAKKKIFEKIAPDLKTDSVGNVVWKTAKASTSAGTVTALNKMPDAHVS